MRLKGIRKWLRQDSIFAENLETLDVFNAEARELEERIAENVSKLLEETV